MSDYPHLFRKLHWWERRDIKDLPEYVKDKTAIPTSVYRVKKWSYEKGGCTFRERDRSIITFSDYIQPATLEEYTNYINTQNPHP